MKKVMVVYGTRPEAIKQAPLIKSLQQHPDIEISIVVTGQHRQILDQVNQLFDITPDHDLEVLVPGQTLNELSARMLTRLDPILASETPDAVVVQGDTTTVAMAAIAAFYRQIPVVHLEAGLRSGDLFLPFPEEANRRVTGRVASLHLAPTQSAKENLLRENFNENEIVVSGNTVVDALMYAIKQPMPTDIDPRLADVMASDNQMILVTAHRRESWGEPMQQIANGVAQLAAKYPDINFVLPMHPNPAVRAILKPTLGEISNVVLTEPADYLLFCHLQQRAHLVLTDSGGVQEEAPSFGKPVLVLRNNTERPEAVTAGTVKLIGNTTQAVVAETSLLIDDQAAYDAMAHAVNPYGDGHAAERSTAAIAELLGIGKRLPDFAS